MAVAPNQPPIISPFIFGGETLETKQRPIGLKCSSAIVKVKYVPINQYADTVIEELPPSSESMDGKPITATTIIM